MENKRIKLEPYFGEVFFYSLNLMYLLEYIFSFFTQKEILPLRLVCKLFDKVFKEKWCHKNIIKLPCNITNNNLKYFSFLKKIDISWNRTIRDKQLSYFKGVNTINLCYCDKITDKGLSYLSGVHTIDLSCCDQITDKGLSYLSGVHTIRLSYCNKIKDEGLSYLTRVHTINLSCCDRITDLDFLI